MGALVSPSQVVSEIVVSAPISGVVTGRTANLGQVVGMGQELFVVTDLSEVLDARLVSVASFSQRGDVVRLDRRNFLRRATGLAVLSVIPAPLIGLTSCSVRGAVRRAGLGEGGYGELTPSRDCPELTLPPDFTVVRLSVSGERMSDAVSTPGDFDGMAAFPLPDGHVRLVRNHEIDTGRLLGDAGKAYDVIGGGGTTSLEVRVRRDGVVEKVRDFVSLGGTIVNCAGGPTPWGTWITCEETTEGRRHGWRQAQGYVFEVPAGAEGQVEARPLPAKGRFVHEAVAVDPATGIVYAVRGGAARSSRAGFGGPVGPEPRAAAVGDAPAVTI